MRPLEGKVAVVTGASRGVGRGVALVLGEAGAKVWVTGRSTRSEHGDIAGTIDDTVEAIRARGGEAVAVRCDHADPAQVRALFERVGELDVLVSNAWGGYEGNDGVGFGDGTCWSDPLWEQALEARWSGMFERGVKAHFITCHAGAGRIRSGGLVVLTTGWDRDHYLGNAVYDVAKHAVVRLAVGLSRDLRPRDVAAIGVAPGLTRTERVVAVAPEAEGESPEYSGRAVLALATDPARIARTGRVFRVGDLARDYDFVDVDGRRIPPFELPP